MRKTAIVDIDNTLWQFCDPLFERMKKINSAVPPPEHWTDWHFFEQYCSEAEFMELINDIHNLQDNADHIPYPEAGNFLSTLQEHGYHITIASHRMPAYMDQTERWLKKHGLFYDDIHLSMNKTELISRATAVVVDDSPFVLEKAVENGVLATGLLFPWNRAFSANGFRLRSNLDEVLQEILQPGR